jgi:hypothetical protein
VPADEPGEREIPRQIGRKIIGTGRIAYSPKEESIYPIIGKEWNPNPFISIGAHGTTGMDIRVRFTGSPGRMRRNLSRESWNLSVKRSFERRKYISHNHDWLGLQPPCFHWSAWNHRNGNPGAHFVNTCPNKALNEPEMIGGYVTKSERRSKIYFLISDSDRNSTPLFPLDFGWGRLAGGRPFRGAQEITGCSSRDVIIRLTDPVLRIRYDPEVVRYPIISCGIATKIGRNSTGNSS